MDFVPRVSPFLFLSNMALQVIALLCSTPTTLFALSVYIAIYFQKATAFLCLYVGCQLGFELVLQ